MATSPEYAEYVLEQISMSGAIRHRKMFGGIGIYIDDIFCAIIGSSNRFYLRVGPDNVDDFKSEGMQKFAGGKGAGMPYYEVPEHILEDPTSLAEWSRKARDAAIRAKKK